MKACPVCGSTDLKLHQNQIAVCAIHGTHPTGFWVECEDCELESPIQPTFQEAVTSWNSL